MKNISNAPYIINVMYIFNLSQTNHKHSRLHAIWPGEKLHSSPYLAPH